MDGGVLASRRAIAQGRVIAAAERLGKNEPSFAAQVDALKAIQAKDPAIKTMMQMDAVADLLEVLAGDAEGIAPSAEALKASKAASTPPAPRKKT